MCRFAFRLPRSLLAFAALALLACTGCYTPRAWIGDIEVDAPEPLQAGTSGHRIGPGEVLVEAGNSSPLFVRDQEALRASVAHRLQTHLGPPRPDATRLLTKITLHAAAPPDDDFTYRRDLTITIESTLPSGETVKTVRESGFPNPDNLTMAGHVVLLLATGFVVGGAVMGAVGSVTYAALSFTGADSLTALSHPLVLGGWGTAVATGLASLIIFGGTVPVMVADTVLQTGEVDELLAEVVLEHAHAVLRATRPATKTHTAPPAPPLTAAPPVTAAPDPAESATSRWAFDIADDANCLDESRLRREVEAFLDPAGHDELRVRARSHNADAMSVAVQVTVEDAGGVMLAEKSVTIAPSDCEEVERLMVQSLRGQLR